MFLDVCSLFVQVGGMGFYWVVGRVFLGGFGWVFAFCSVLSTGTVLFL